MRRDFDSAAAQAETTSSASSEILTMRVHGIKTRLRSFWKWWRLLGLSFYESFARRAFQLPFICPPESAHLCGKVRLHSRIGLRRDGLAPLRVQFGDNPMTRRGCTPKCPALMA
jgi:hypothetical protein